MYNFLAGVIYLAACDADADNSLGVGIFAESIAVDIQEVAYLLDIIIAVEFSLWARPYHTQWVL